MFSVSFKKHFFWVCRTCPKEKMILTLNRGQNKQTDVAFYAAATFYSLHKYKSSCQQLRHNSNWPLGIDKCQKQGFNYHLPRNRGK